MKIKIKQTVDKMMGIRRLGGLTFLVIVLLVSGCAPQQGVVPEEPISTAVESPEVATEDPFIEARQRLTAHAVTVQDLQDADVIRALGVVPRHRFVPESLIDSAYHDTALPIGYGQTISQPSLVALMTELLELEPGDKVLEIGTGSGYQAAILAELGFVEVYSIEIVPELYERSTEILNELGYDNVNTMAADGYYGWEEYAPFDAIIVTAAPDHMPPPLAEQLAEGGVMVIPIGPPGFTQTLWKFVKQDGELTAQNMGYVRFVPFTGEGIESQ
jgi:protein-L-isoaspartate(D-aspartate) O-methyltransferase